MNITYYETAFAESAVGGAAASERARAAGPVFDANSLRPAMGHDATLGVTGNIQTIELLRAALACESACAASYRRHRLEATQLEQWDSAIRFLCYASEKRVHCRRLGLWIAWIGGSAAPEVVDEDGTIPPGFGRHLSTVQSMISTDIDLESKVIDSYCHALSCLDDADASTRAMIEALLMEELELVDAMRTWAKH